VGYLPEVANYYDFMDAEELLRFYGRLCDLSAGEIREGSDRMLSLVGLESVRRRPLRQYSKGMLQRAGIAQALLHDPDLLILDEPTTGLDPLGRRQVRDVILSLREQGKTVLFSSHELSEAEMVCDRVGILNGGVLSWCGPTREVAGDGSGNLERAFLEIIAPERGVP
jgi:ABC-2 type transport system ATP-binding protein